MTDSSPEPPASHQARGMAESFGLDAARYDRSRPDYPDALIDRIVAGRVGLDVLDVGCGTGIAGRQLRAAGAVVLGIEPDERMAQVARAHGLRVELATFEQWQPDGRTFDAVVAAQSWHWVDPAVGATKAADVLRPDGLLTIVGHVYEPPTPVAQPFAAAFAAVVPDAPFALAPDRRPVEAYQHLYAGIGERLTGSGRFDRIEQWRLDWDHVYTRDQWLDLLPTTGGMTRLTADQTAHVLDAVGTAIDELGGSFTMTYTTLAVLARRP